MKKIFNIALAIAAALTLVSCAEFLERPSKTSMDDENYWSSETNLRLFVNGGYTNYFVGHYSGWSAGYDSAVRGDGSSYTEWSDDVMYSSSQIENYVAATSFDGVSTDGTAISFYIRSQSGAWNYGWVRKWNIMIERVDMMKENGILTEEAYKHWMGVARFFRAYQYSRMVQSFGDVPYYDKTMEPTDFETQFKPRDSRVLVMTKCMEDFKYAMENVRTEDGENAVNKGVVGTIGSRFMLFEGTWEKYHKTPNGTPNAFLQAALDLAGGVMALGKYDCDASFKDLLGSETKKGKEAIMYRSYSAAQSVRHCTSTYCMPQYGQGGYPTFNYLESWICTDGKVRATSTVANKDSWRVQDMRITRDPRFEATFYDEPNSSGGGTLFTWKFIDREGPKAYYENQNKGTAIPSKYGSAYNEIGYPVVRYAETLLNWIEAKAELGDVSQADLDKSINVIRKRPLDATETELGCQQTAPLTLALAEENAANDPQYNDAVYKTTLAYKNGFAAPKPILWEIRRERRMEFYDEYRRATDIRRWGEIERLNNATNPKTTFGVWIEASELGENKAEYGGDKSNPKYFGAYKKQYTLTANSKLLTTTSIDAASYEEVVIKQYAPVAEDGKIVSSNLADMSGFARPSSFIPRQRTITERDYLLPVPLSVVNQYKAKVQEYPDGGYQEIAQNPGW